MLYTFEIYKIDRRTKTGVRLVKKYDMECTSSIAERHLKELEDSDPKLDVKLFETMVERRNIMNGEIFLERYDTPYYCSPSSETYWSM